MKENWIWNRVRFGEGWALPGYSCLSHATRTCSASTTWPRYGTCWWWNKEIIFDRNPRFFCILWSRRLCLTNVKSCDFSIASTGNAFYLIILAHDTKRWRWWYGRRGWKKPNILRRSWYNVYRRRKWTQWSKLKSGTRLPAFHIALKTLTRVIHQTILPPANSIGLFYLCMATDLGEGKFWIQVS